MGNNFDKSNDGHKFISIFKKIIRSKWFKVVLVLVILSVAAAFGFKWFKANKMKDKVATTETAKSAKRDIQQVLSSSGTVEALHTYSVQSLVDGEVIAADFEEGDEVKKGDILYRISSSSLDTKIKSARTSVTRAQEKYNKAVSDYKEAVEKYEDETGTIYDDQNVKAKASGIISELKVNVGDDVQSGTEIGTIYNNSYMLLTLSFSADSVNKNWVGKTAAVEIESSGDSLKGTVTKVSSIKKVLTGNRVVKDVTIRVKNPGGITTDTIATATINGVSCSNDGTFTVYEQKSITAEASGKVTKINIQEGSSVKKGQTILALDSDSLTSQADTYKSSVKNAKQSVSDAKNSVEDAKLSLQEQLDNETDYCITAPISGTIVSKDVLTGDTIKASNADTSLCEIYDLSALKFDMSIDELDISEVQTGQKVEITSDALGDDTTIEGVITNVSLKGTTSNGVTNYPVTVKISDPGKLLPGMNVTGKIIVEEAKDVIAVPVDAVMRGNVVYVKDDSVKKANGDVPAGFKEVKVTTGISDDDYVEIKSGLEENVEVYIERQSSGTTQQMMPGGGMPGGSGGGPNGGGGPSGGGGAPSGGK